MSRVAVVQMQSVDDLQANLDAAAGFIRQAAEEGAVLVALPENFGYLGRRERDKCALAERHGSGAMQDFLAGQAQQHGLWLLAGSVPLRADNDNAEPAEKVHAASLLYDDTGGCVARYDKIHLFDVEIPGKPGDKPERYLESNSHHAGERCVVADTPVGRLGLSVCYDLRFPELYRELVDQGAELLAVPSAFTEATGRAHWDLLLRARAVENSCYVLAPDQWGEHPGGRRTYGASQIIDPWGEVLAREADGTGIAVAEVDREHLQQVRSRFPCLQHRRLGRRTD